MKPVRIEDLFEYRFLSSIEMSPVGEWAAFVVKHTDVENNAYASDIYLVHPARGDVTRWTASGKDGPFAWEAAGDAILFVSDRADSGEGGTLYRIRVAGGEATRALTLPHKPESFRPLADGRILFTARVPLDDAPDPLPADAADYEVLEEIPFWQNGKGFTSRKRVRLFLFDPASESLTTLTEPELEIQSFDCLADRVAYIARRFPGKAALTDELWLHSLPTGESECLSRDELSLGEVRFLDRDRILVLASDMAQYGRGQNRELYLYDLPGRTSHTLTPDWDRSVGNSVAADCRHGGGPMLRVDHGDAYLVVTEGSKSKVVRVTPDRDVTVVAEPNGSVDGFAVAEDGVLCIELHPDALQELYLHDGSGVRRLTSLNENSLAERAVSLPESFAVTHGSTHLDAWLIRPHAFDPNASYPTILTVHGGPRGAYGDVFFHEMQCLAADGYALIYTNPRGSSGKGNDFADLRG